jgi:polysaccharide pyruvyl transferase WcaK-like protein
MLSRLRRRYVLRGIQHVIFGGGSNFHTTGIIRDFTATLRAAGGGPHFALGVSVGPFRDADAEGACAELFTLLRYVGVRGHTSLERACRLAPPSTEVEQTFDLAPLLPVAAGVPLSRSACANKRLAVCLCNHERFSGGSLAEEARRVDIVAQSIAECARASVCDQVVLVDMNSHASEGDAELNRHLAKRLEGVVPVRHENYQGEPLATMRILGEVKGVLAMRLHAAVFAFCAGTPFAMVAYHEKCSEWMHAVGGANSLILPAQQLEASKLVQMVRTLMSSSLCTRPRVKIEQAIAASQRNWERAKQCLGCRRPLSPGAEQGSASSARSQRTLAWARRAQ